MPRELNLETINDNMGGRKYSGKRERKKERATMVGGGAATAIKADMNAQAHFIESLLYSK